MPQQNLLTLNNAGENPKVIRIQTQDLHQDKVHRNRLATNLEILGPIPANPDTKTKGCGKAKEQSIAWHYFRTNAVGIGSKTWMECTWRANQHSLFQ